MTAAVSDSVKNRVAGYLEDALGRPVESASAPGETALSDFGLDSLLTISVIVALLDDCGVDMIEHSDALVTPSTLADLHALAARFLEGDDTVVDNGHIDEENAHLAYYSSKLAYEMDSADLWDALAEDQKVVVVDGRSSDAYAAEHLRGAVSIPHRSISAELLEGWSKEPLYVAYCDGIGCNASTKTALKLATAGFQVKELIGGLEWWKKEGYPTDGTAAQCAADGTHQACGCAG